jgi:hypothetical protein
MPDCGIEGQMLPDPHKLYIHGVRFLYADEFLRAKSVDDKTASQFNMFPGMVISAFAAELFLKCLLILEGHTPNNTHNLGSLFKPLHNKTKARIEELWDTSVLARSAQFEMSEKFTNLEMARDLRGALKECGNAFEELRYLYEDPMNVRFYIGDLAGILEGVILELKADWRNPTRPYGMDGQRSGSR